MKHLIIILTLFTCSCVARELTLKESIINFDKINSNKIFLNETKFDNEKYKDISKEINTELFKLFKSNNKLEIVENKSNSNIVIETKIIEFSENIYLDQFNSPYAINNNISNRNSASLQISLSFQFKVINNDSILFDEIIKETQSIQVNNISNLQLANIDNKENGIYLDLKNKLIQTIIKRIFYYINPSYIYVNIYE